MYNEVLLLAPIALMILAGFYALIAISSNVNQLALESLKTPHQFTANVTTENITAKVYGTMDKVIVVGELNKRKLVIIHSEEKAKTNIKSVG